MAQEVSFKINVIGEDAIKALQRLETEIEDINAAQKKLRSANEKTGKTYQENTVRLKQLRSAQTRVRSEITKTTSFTKRMSNSFATAALKIGAMYVGFQTLSRIVTGSIKTMREFESAMTKVKVITGATSEEFDKLKQNALGLGASTIFTATEVANLQVALSKLGFSTQEILDSTDAITQLAAATGEDLAESATIAASTVRGFGLDAKDTQRVVDVMAASFTSSSLDLAKFSTAMATVAPVAKNAGVSIERTTAILGKITDAGVDASTAGTSLRNVFLELSKQGLTFDEAMQKIQDSTDKNATSLELFGKRGAVVGTIIADNEEAINKFTTALEESGGTAERMAKEELSTLDNQLKLLNSAWDGFILSLNDGDGVISSVFKGLVGWLTDTVTNLDLMNKSYEDIIKGVEKSAVQEVLRADAKELADLTKKFSEFLPKEEAATKANNAMVESLQGLFGWEEKENDAIDVRIAALKELAPAQKTAIEILNEEAEATRKAALAKSLADEEAKKAAIKNAKAKEKAISDEVEFRKQLGLDEEEEELSLDVEEKSIFETINGYKEDDLISNLESDLAIKGENQAKEILAEKKAAEEKIRIANAERDAKYDAASTLLGALSGLAKRGSKLAKAAALAQIGVDTAKAISSLIAASNANPLNATTFGGAGIAQYAAGFASILTNVAKAKGIISGTGFADGGFTGAGTYKDSTGHRVAGVVHDNEYVVPKNVLQTDTGAALVSQLDSMRGFAAGGYTSTPSRANIQAIGNSGTSTNIQESIQQQPQRVYVLESDISSTQRSVEVIENDITF